MPRLAAASLVLALLTFGGARIASAQVVILSSTAVGHMKLETRSRDLTLRAPGFAVCAEDGSDFCRGLHPYKIEMDVYPHWEFRVPLPEGFMLTNHNWTMEHDAADLSLRQAMVGGTVRYQPGQLYWLELGAALAEQSISHPEATELFASGDVGHLGPAALAGVGGWIHLGSHAELDLRLRGGVSLGDDDASRVYYTNLVVSFAGR